jgi:HEAT repeat protein
MSRMIKTFSDRLTLARRLPAPLRIAALGEALACASPEEAERLVPELLDLAVVPTFEEKGPAVRAGSTLPFVQRRTERLADLALAQIARSWRQVIPEVAQAVLAVGEDRWASVLPRLSTDPSTPVRLSLAALVGDAGDTRVSYLLSGMLHDQDKDVRDQAEQSLLLMALSVLRQELAANPGTARYVSNATPTHLRRVVHVGLRGPLDELYEHVAEAAMTIGEHRRRGPVLAALVLASRQHLRSDGDGAAALRAWLANEHHPSQSVLRSVIRWSRVPVARLRALELLSREHLAIACLNRLLRSQSLLDHELVLANAHLLTRPRRSAKLAGSKPTLPRPPRAKGRGEDESTLPAAGAVRQLSEDARRGLPRFVMALPIGVAARQTAIAPLLSDESPVVRHAACRVTPAAGLEDYCFDRDERVACSAFLRWSNAGAGVERATDARLLGLLSRSPHARLRTWASQERTQCEEGVGTVAGRLAMRRIMAADRAAYVEGVRRRLRSGDSGPAFTALAEVRALGIVHEFEGDVLALAAGDGDVRVLATAAAALGHLSGPRAAELARRLTAHADARVRANAVEALARLTRRGVDPARKLSGLEEVIVELKSDAHHRVRANAIRAGLLEACGGVDAAGLAHMLMDERPMHRVAGVWVAGRVLATPTRTPLSEKLPEFIARIGELARHDEDERVRTRARACEQRLGAALRAAWKSPAAPVISTMIVGAGVAAGAGAITATIAEAATGAGATAGEAA